MITLKEKQECRFCFNDCEREHDFKEDKEFIDICDDCLNDILSKKEVKRDLKLYEGKRDLNLKECVGK